MLVDQQAGRLARSDKVLMCGSIKEWTTDCILEADTLDLSYAARVVLGR